MVLMHLFNDKKEVWLGFQKLYYDYAMTTANKFQFTSLMLLRWKKPEKSLYGFSIEMLWYTVEIV